jgi:hypothetical protein
MYRGDGGIAVPDLLKSMHMALEKFLLKLAKEAKIDVVESYLLYLIQHSKSASITAIVTSVVLAYPEKYYNVAMILFKTLDFFHQDNIRQQQESQAKLLYSIGLGLNKQANTCVEERLKTCEDKHRTSSLESLIVNYQFFGIHGADQQDSEKLIQDIYNIIDCHHKRIETENKNDPTLKILLARIDRRNMKLSVKDTEDGNMLIELNPQLSPDLHEHREQAMKQFEDVFKYTSLRLWSDFIHNNNPNSSQKYKQYEENPKLALKETKQLLDELKNTNQDYFAMNHAIPSFVCSKLMIEHRDTLSKKDKNYCKKIITEFISYLFSDDYNYQISDGIEAAIHAIPSLMNEYPNEKENFAQIMLLALFDVTPIGKYKRVCDYVIESILESKLWESHPNDAQSILLGFIKLKPIYNQIYTEKRKKQNAWGVRIPKSTILQELDKKVTNFSFTNISFDIHDINSFDIYDLEIIYQIIPSNTTDNIHFKIYEKSLPLLASQLLNDRRSDSDVYGNDSNIYLLRLHIFKRFATFILEREINEIDIYLQPFVDNFDATEETASFLDEIVSAEDYNNKYEQFWYIWNKLYPKVIEICNSSRGFHLDKVINSYMLAWQWRREGVTEWHSLKKENLSFYANVAKNIGHNSTVLYSITKVLNSIGSNFTDDGINWIYSIVLNNKSLKLGDLESNTLYYLEKIMRKFVFVNREKIKRELKLKNQVVPILEFIIERGSVQGYLLRESIL